MSIQPAPGWVVGTVHSESSLRSARALDALPAAPDLLELRIDHFADQPPGLEALAALATESCRPLIMTVRDSAEGGAQNLDPASRQALYERFLPWAHYVDIELGSLAALEPVAGQARRTSGGLIASYHDFAGQWDLAGLHERAGRAVDAGAALFKVAVQVEHPRQLVVLLEFLATETRLRLAAMGMGPLGRISRLAAAASGSQLNYGYLGESAQVPGQWPAAVLRARMNELWQGASPEADREDFGRASDPEGACQRSTG